jgi:hypothetical protein
MIANLDGAFRQLARAKERLKDLELRRETLRQGQEAVMRPKFNRTRTRVSYVLPNPIPELSVDVGEVLQALRSSLDYLIRGLSILDSDGRKPKHKTQFLIEDCEQIFEKRIKTRLEGLSDEHIACIRDLQPYKGCEWTGRLRDLNDWHKHNEPVNITSTGHNTYTVHEFATKADAQGNIAVPASVQVQQQFVSDITSTMGRRS